ncbi:amino acid ABC transporter substrate-binding protein [Stutzerimonas stutzeri]|uniref:Amino acid ABC transporter substrate-binding protein n=1 Tax=Stutzerimonas stutzeri TaxID=316 RepID=W8RYQ6_STUST|nr:transporter substrate-binding domain-containing protein [Stutzerimonas stutzeri]AHL77261.1 amino acid ABC transporter substrate-binding protein [Stutzerimonas stutzeri]MCQ4330152.1 transporter substrate-binding domain-containing protein [Stutzerimonas stutzeri]
MKGRWRRGLLLSLAISLGAHAGEVQLVTGDDYAPLTGKSLAGAGVMSEVVQAAFARSGMSSSLAWQPWNRGYLMTRRGEYDATFPYIRAERRERDFLYSAPLYVSEQHLFSRAGDALELEDLARNGQLRLCHPLGWQLPRGVQAQVEQGLLIRHSPPGLAECAQLLLLGRDDLFVADLLLGHHALLSTGATGWRFHVSRSVLSRQTMHLIVPRSRAGAKALIERFDQGLAALRASGDYQRLIERMLANDALAEVQPFDEAR